jgi:hypothetical protein
MRSIVLCALALSLVGCGHADRAIAKYTGHAKMCVDGVTYLQFTSGATVQVDRDGHPVPC